MKKIVYVLMCFAVILSVTLIITSCQHKPEKEDRRTIGSIERIDPEINQILPEHAVIQILAEGFEWSEGPLWVSTGDYLLFSDIPLNRIYKWSRQDGLTIYLEPSGYTGEIPRKGEPGSNGLLLDPEGSLVLCQHGDRRIAKMDAPLHAPKSEYITMAGYYDDKRLNSPNDACYHSNGTLYFTDPPYGLEGNVNDPDKELDHQGVYKLSRDGSLQLLTKDLSRPNGIAFSPNEKTLYVANSDPERAIWMAYDVKPDGSIGNGRLLHDATSRVGKERGLPDGLKVSSKGYIFATGPGGVWVFNPVGKHIGTIRTTQATANCAFNEDESALYITADMYLLRVDLKFQE
jgi:gluconolactonase